MIVVAGWWDEANDEVVMKRRAFTLIELLVVIGIIAVLVGVLIPLTMRAYRVADAKRTQADLNTLGVALEAFKGDFDDYPRPNAPNTGFADLGRFLVGPYGTLGTDFIPPTAPYLVGDCAKTGSPPNEVEYVCIFPTASPPPSANWQGFGFTDQKPGPGIKRPRGGHVYGPYIQADKFKMRGLAILDRQGNPILYFAASPGRPNIHTANGFATVDAYSGPKNGSRYNLADDEIFFRASGESNAQYSGPAIQQMLGDKNSNGVIDAGETEAASAPFLLWSAGADGIYGPPRLASSSVTAQQIQACDDVTSFK
jgi:prepilin-type N-terminal cleavage/methylation domain-containing protein